MRSGTSVSKLLCAVPNLDAKGRVCSQQRRTRRAGCAQKSIRAVRTCNVVRSAAAHQRQHSPPPHVNQSCCFIPLRSSHSHSPPHPRREPVRPPARHWPVAGAGRRKSRQPCFVMASRRLACGPSNQSTYPPPLDRLSLSLSHTHPPPLFLTTTPPPFSRRSLLSCPPRHAPVVHLSACLRSRLGGPPDPWTDVTAPSLSHLPYHLTYLAI
ncbi:hypothetical protein IWX90DRAFT_301632 [Phyllosticta citrichinensis]|uniref:Uncharacterized protein n=1 Tax=Phyllosticta citrichinensis TaxID=1130410 RepID=A0ABR1XKX7_9PEZI